MRPDRHGQDGGLHAAAAQPPAARRQRRQRDQIGHHRAHARAGDADRPAVPGLFVLPARIDHGGLRRRRRQGLGRAETRHADGLGRGDRHAGPHDLAPSEQRRGPLARRVPDPRRGGPHARHGFQRGHHEDRILHAARATDDHVLGDPAAQDPRTGEDHSAQPRGGEHRHLETERSHRPVGLRLPRGPEAGHHPRDVRRAAALQDDHILVVEDEGQGAGPHAQAHEARRGRHALRPGASAARRGDARLQERQDRHPGRHGHRGPRHRHRGHRPGGELRRAARPRGLHPPHRPHGARRGFGCGRNLRQ